MKEKSGSPLNDAWMWRDCIRMTVQVMGKAGKSYMESSTIMPRKLWPDVSDGWWKVTIKPGIQAMVDTIKERDDEPAETGT